MRFVRLPSGLTMLERTSDEEREARTLNAERTFRLFAGRRTGFTPSSGNVFRDLGLPNADALQAEADARIAAMQDERRRKALRPEYV